MCTASQVELNGSKHLAIKYSSVPACQHHIPLIIQHYIIPKSALLTTTFSDKNVWFFVRIYGMILVV